MLESLLEAGGFGEADIQEISGATKLLIRVKKVEGKLADVSKTIGDIFATNMAGNPYVVDSTSEVGPTVGKKLQRDAFWAIVISLFGILFYIGWRFEFRFGIAAVVATFHDVLAVLGILFLFNHEINLLVITALLTIAGYSINDSVVVFDRIRENLKKRGKSKEELDTAYKQVGKRDAPQDHSHLRNDSACPCSALCTRRRGDTRVRLNPYSRSTYRNIFLNLCRKSAASSLEGQKGKLVNFED